ncbi:hypothetical protein [Ekhidna sp.]|uniref:hypothetical protein n=1 Tax=Ekhidna sp. TaxID=2608089 RepID=UPI003298FCDB
MNQNQLATIISWLFGVLVLSLGIMNILRGNDPFFGVALLLASSVYFPPTYNLLKKLSGLSPHYMLRIILALLIIWVNLAVGAINEGYYPEITG